MNIVLIGMRGAGKTSVAKLLSKKLNKPYIEMDDLIVEKAGMTTSDIVRKHGWEYFRDLESKVVADVSEKDNIIISCGGGVVVRPKNITMLQQNGKIYWLQVSVPTILSRIGNDPNRPSLTGKPQKEDIEEVLRERYMLYKNAAHEIIDTENTIPEYIAKRIIDTYGY